MKTPPIAFTQDNFSAVLSGFKTETRRLLTVRDLPQELVTELKSFYQDGDGNWIGWSDDLPSAAEFTKLAYPKGSNKGIKSTYQIGDRCYLTEPTQVLCTNPEDSINIESCDVAYFWGDKLTSWEGISDRRWVDLAEGDSEKLCNRKTGICSKQTARFMLKSFARYWVEITDVRIERLLDITDEGAIAEGIKYQDYRDDMGFYRSWFDYTQNSYRFKDPILSYISEIEMLHGKAIGKLHGKTVAQLNPWLWVYRFKLIAP